MRLSPVEKIFLAGFLKRYIRVGFLFVQYKETVAAHSFRTAYIAFELACVHGEDPGRYVRDALWHDFHEAIVLDTSYLGLRFVEPSEAELRQHFGLPEISDIVKDADILEVIATAWEWNVNGAELWIDSAIRRLKFSESRELAEAILKHRHGSAFYKALMENVEVGPAERILLAGILKHLPRACWLAAGIKEPESVADHVFRTAIIADLLAQEEGADPEEEVVLAVLHHIPEAIVGSRHKMAKVYTNVNKKEVWRFLGLEEPKTTEIVRDADLLELLTTIREYESIGVNGLERWKKTALKELKTETAKRWADSILSAPPLGEWYTNFLTRGSA